MMPLTGRQAEVLTLIRDEVRKRGYPPTYREIGVRIGTSSTNNVHGHLTALERKGFITRDRGRIVMTDKSLQLGDEWIPEVPAGEDWIQTFTGRKFYPLRPRAEDVDIEDIAQALSNICRFTGHTTCFYSVAQHSVHVSANCPPEVALWGLLHDASEAYLADVARPVKRTPEFAHYKVIERRVMEAICERFELHSPIEPEEVKVADNRMLATEARDLMGPKHPDWVWPATPYDWRITNLLPTKARALFLDTFRSLTL